MLTNSVKTCEFLNQDDEMIDQVIEKCKSNKLRKKLLSGNGLTRKRFSVFVAIGQVSLSTNVKSQRHFSSLFSLTFLNQSTCRSFMLTLSDSHEMSTPLSLQTSHHITSQTTNHLTTYKI